MQAEIDELSTRIEEITEELRLTHLREAVLKARLNKTIERKCNLVELQIQARAVEAQANQPVHFVAPVNAVIVEEDISAINRDNNSPRSGISSDENESVPARQSVGRKGFRGKRTSQKTPSVRDRDGVQITVGDEVRFLTSGVNRSNFGEV